MDAADPKLTRPNPADYEDFRVYLQAMIAHLKATTRKFTYRQFSRDAGFKSPNFLKLVAEGKRGLSHGSIARFGKALELSDAEFEIFEALVHLDLSTTDEERNRYYRKLQKAKKRSPAARFEKAQYDAYTNWYVLPIREMVLWKNFREDPRWIAQQLRPRIKPRQAREALEILIGTGFLARDAQGKLQVSEPKLSTPATVRTLAVRNYHRALLKHAAMSLDRTAKEQRNVTSLTFSLTPSQYAQVCKRIEVFREELFDFIESEPPGEDDDPRDVHAVVFAAFPMTRTLPI